MSDVPLPPLQDDRVGQDVVERLLADLAAVARVLDVRVRGAGAARGAAAPSLAHAREALASGGSVQLRYQHAGAAWCDTLMPSGDRVRIVRIRLP